MNEAVLDASVVLKWFHSPGRTASSQHRELRERFEAGELRVLAPSLLWLEILNVAARRWGWTAPQLEQLAAALPELGFDLIEPELTGIAHWAARGLTAYDAAYVAIAEQTGAQLVTDHDEIVGTAPELAAALGTA
ncbi:MAG TPA: type II toxin-antitoxin system VapC family toxin [Solirubrobacterales bacterium]|nr:type II toxin-antitoxin system VapC family toxin [Solirubrobacterales bacterium]